MLSADRSRLPVRAHPLPDDRDPPSPTAQDQLGQVRLGDGVAAPGVDAHVEHPVRLAPLLVDMAVQEPLPTVRGAVLEVALLIPTVTALRKVVGKNATFSDGHSHRSGMDREAGCLVLHPPPVDRVLLLAP